MKSKEPKEKKHTEKNSLKITNEEKNLLNQFAKTETEKQIKEFITTTQRKTEKQQTEETETKNSLRVVFKQASSIASQIFCKQIETNIFKNCSTFVSEEDQVLFEGLEYAEILAGRRKNGYSRMVKEYFALKDLVC